MTRMAHLIVLGDKYTFVQSAQMSENPKNELASWETRNIHFVMSLCKVRL